MTKTSRVLTLRACALVAVLGLSSGCTYFDRFFPGSPFSLEQPVAEVTLVGQMQIDRSPGGGGCTPGGTLFWGTVRNTGDIVVVDVSITIDAFAASGAFLGSFQTAVFSGAISTSTDTNSFDQASTSLRVDESGSFEVCTPLSFGSVARTEYRTDFVIIDVVELE